MALVCAHKFIGGSGLSSSDLSGNGNDLSVEGGASWEDDGLQCDASGEIGLIDNTDNGVVNSNTGTIIIKFKGLGSIEDNAFRFLFGDFTGSEGGFGVYKSSNNKIYFNITDDEWDHYVAIAPEDIPNWETGTQIAVMWDRTATVWNSDNMVINIDGVNIVPTFDDEEAAWNEFDVDVSLGVLNNSQETSQFLNGTIEYVYVFSTLLSESDILEVYNDPDSVLSEDVENVLLLPINIGVGCGL